jgi:hydrogenase maturation protein HypF
MIRGLRIVVSGTVQGVGFRPWVLRQARELGVSGRVCNDAAGVRIEAFAAEPVLETFLDQLAQRSPGHVRSLSRTPIPVEALTGFCIDETHAAGAIALSIPPDLATCPACLAELADPADRRYRYPFINCTGCGPRFTIATDLPYDRATTTMARFPLCDDCAREYGDPSDRRFHAEPIACPRCGPSLRIEPPAGDDPLASAVALLLAGKIVGVKGLGGFHLACDAASPAAVASLRARKHRDRKPFALMVRDLDEARRLAFLRPEDEALLTGAERPITLVTRRPDAAVAAEVAPDTPLLGLFLPYTPLHHLLLDAAKRALVMTSGNLSDEPIAKDDDDARARLAPLCDALLVHDRPIATRCDDSVARVIAGGPMLLRRSRGYVPRPIPLARALARPVLAVGAELQSTFCLARGDSAYLGPHIGDLDNLLAHDFFVEAIERMERLVHVRPAIIAHDLHPDYLSTRYALAREGAQRVAVQHHHAHVIAVKAEHGIEGSVLGLAWDGVGLGSDGTPWGGELLLARDEGFERLATLRPIALAGGDTAVRQVWRIALALLDDAFDGAPPLDRLPLFRHVPARDRTVVRQMIAAQLNSPRAHGVGRLFDGVGALCLERPVAFHEAQIALAWNHAAVAGEQGAYPFDLDRARPVIELDHRPMVRALVGDLLAGCPASVIAARFHRTLVRAGASLVREAVRAVGPLPLVLAGGCFQNPLLAEGLIEALGGELPVHLPRALPPGDSGLALGQAVIAAAVLEGKAASCA